MSKVYITKYALTAGVIECEVDRSRDTRTDGSVTVKWPGGLNGTAHFYGNQWQLTKEDAFKRADEMRKAKLKSLAKQVHKLEDMRFTEVSKP